MIQVFLSLVTHWDNWIPTFLYLISFVVLVQNLILSLLTIIRLGRCFRERSFSIKKMTPPNDEG